MTLVGLQRGGKHLQKHFPETKNPEKFLKIPESFQNLLEIIQLFATLFISNFYTSHNYGKNSKLRQLTYEIKCPNYKKVIMR